MKNFKHLYVWLMVFVMISSTIITALPSNVLAGSEIDTQVENGNDSGNAQEDGNDSGNTQDENGNNDGNTQEENESDSEIGIQIEIGKYYKLKLSKNFETQQLTIAQDTVVVGTALAGEAFEVKVGAEKIKLTKQDVSVVELYNEASPVVTGQVTTTNPFTVYQDATKKSVLLSGTKSIPLNVVNYQNGMYKVEVGNSVGYLPLAHTVSYTYASVKKDTNLYLKDTKTVVAQLKASTNIYHVKRANDPSFYGIDWQGQELYIKASDLTFKNQGTTAKVKATIFTLTLPKNTALYKDTISKTVIGSLNAEKDVKIVGQTNGYYEIQFGGVSAYIKANGSYNATVIKNGSLLDSKNKVVGTIVKSSKSYIVVPTKDINKFQIKIGSSNYLIDASILKLNTTVLSSPKVYRKDMIQLKANTKVYTDATLKTPIITLTNATRTGILSIHGSNYKIQVGNGYGYVPISSTTGQFTAKLKYNAPLYGNTKKSAVIAKNADSTSVYVVSKTSDNNLFTIQMGSNKYYVNYADLTFTNQAVTSLKTTRKDTVTTKKGFVLYKNASTKNPIMKSGIANQKFVIQGTVGQYYIVHLGNSVAYLPAKFVTGVANKEVTATSTILYKYVNKKYVAVGTVVKGYTFKSTSENGTYYLFKKGNETFAIKKNTVIGSNKSISLKAKSTATYPITLYTEKAATVYDAKGVKIGTLNKGQSVPLKGISSSNKGIIDFMGQQAQVDLKDFYHKNIVNGASNISHGKMAYYVKVFSLLYPEFTKREVIGYSAEGRAIHAIRLGNGEKEILMDGAFHAREHMTTNVLLEMIDSYSAAYRTGSKFNGWEVKKTLDITSIWFIPMMNPDGVMLVQQGISALKNPTNIKNAKKYASNGSYKHWKANGRGVDLNQNFDGVNWYKLSKVKGYQNYVGPSAFSEPETKAFVNFVNKHNFKTNVSYHSSGSIIYWGGVQNKSELARDRKLVNQFAKVTRYSPIEPWGAAANYKYGSGNSTAWLIRVKRIPAITMEIGTYQGQKPVSLKEWSTVWNKNKTIGLIAAKEAATR